MLCSHPWSVIHALIQALMQVAKTGVDLEGSPEEIAEKLVKDEAAEELKQRELQRKGAKQVDGVAGSGLKRGEPSAIAQVCTSRTTYRKLPTLQESARDCLAEHLVHA